MHYYPITINHNLVYFIPHKIKLAWSHDCYSSFSYVYPHSIPLFSSYIFHSLMLREARFLEELTQSIEHAII